MLWTLNIELLSSSKALLGAELIIGADEVYKIPVTSLRIGVIFICITLTLGFKKKEHK